MLLTYEAPQSYTFTCVNNPVVLLAIVKTSFITGLTPLDLLSSLIVKDWAGLSPSAVLVFTFVRSRWSSDILRVGLTRSIPVLSRGSSVLVVSWGLGFPFRT